MSRTNRFLVAVVALLSIGFAAANSEAADLYDQAFAGYVHLRTPAGAQVSYHWHIYFGPNSGGNSGGVALIASGVPIFGTHHDYGYYSVVFLDNPPYDSVVLVSKSGWVCTLEAFADRAGNSLSSPGSFLWPTW